MKRGMKKRVQFHLHLFKNFVRFYYTWFILKDDFSRRGWADCPWARENLSGGRMLCRPVLKD
jgi:hypothetical protein